MVAGLASEVISSLACFVQLDHTNTKQATHDIDNAMTQISRNLIYILTASLFAAPAISDAEQTTRRYRTLEERRESGVSHQLTEWLRVSPLIELEHLTYVSIPENLPAATFRERSKIFELDIQMEPVDWISAEIVYEYDDLLNESVVDEALVEFEYGDYRLELGKLYLPFGEYFSRFVSGPILEIGETRARSIVLSYEADDYIELELFFFKSKIDHITIGNNSSDWGAAVNFSLSDAASAGISYLSDLSETDERLLQDSATYEKRVGAVSAYLALDLGFCDSSIEWLTATDSYTELSADRNHPQAWNLELAFFPADRLELAIRIETSSEIEDAPERQFGLAFTLHPAKNIITTLEFLQGKYKPGLAADQDDNPLNKNKLLAAQLSLSF